MAKGSGRSVGGVDLVKVLTECEPHLEHWGGHPMAVGVKLPQQNLEVFSKAFDQAMNRFYPEGVPEPELDIACWVNFEDLGDGLMEELSLLEPYGQMNPEPILGLKGVMLKEEAKTFAKIHKRFILTHNEQREKMIEGIAWNFNNMPNANEPVDLAVRLEWNTWNNKTTSRVILVDWKKSIL
jgi:single-stranded-DNA-specific exonuclease